VTDLHVALPDELVESIAAALAPRLLAELPKAEQELWQLWDLSETARRLGRSERWVRERTKRAELPFVRLDGGALAYRPEDVQAFAAARRVPALEE
jgi:hypothetical protein